MKPMINDRSLRPLFLLVLPLIAMALHGQVDPALLAREEGGMSAAVVEDEEPALTDYDALVPALGGDSVRISNGFPCIGWVEDRWPAGGLKHRGYYNDGRLVVFKNYHQNGAMEREFKMLDDRRCQTRTYYSNGTLRSEALHVEGVCLKYADHYPSGLLRYQEEKHKSEPYYMVMDIYAADGKPISTLHIVDKKKVVFEQKEYHPSGQIRSAGRAQFDPGSMDTKRIGTWTNYDVQGVPISEEHYVEGRLHDSREL